MGRILDTSKVRYYPPSKLEQAPYGTIVYVDSEKDGLITYIQLSDDPEEPNWLKGRNLLEAVFQDLLHEPEFMEILIKIFHTKNKHNFLTLADIIKTKYENGDVL